MPRRLMLRDDEATGFRKVFTAAHLELGSTDDAKQSDAGTPAQSDAFHRPRAGPERQPRSKNEIKRGDDVEGREVDKRPNNDHGPRTRLRRISHRHASELRRRPMAHLANS